MEPIRISAVRSGIDRVVAAPGLDRVERDEPREQPESRGRRRPPRRRPPPPDDGRPHVDVEA